MPSPLHIGIVGAGSIVRERHLPGLAGLPDVEITAVCNSDPTSSARAAAEHGIPVVHTDWRALVTDPRLDAVVVGTHPCLHADVSIAALDAGKHVFCQARMATDLPAALRMLEATLRNPTRVAMLCPAPNALKYGSAFTRLLTTGTIGRLLHFRLVVLGDQWSDPSSPAHWRQKTELSGQNILSLGIYAETLRRLIGQPTSLVAQARIAHPLRQGYVVGVPDLVNVLGNWPDGLVGALEFSGVSRFGPREELVIYGEQGTLAYDFKTDEVRLARANYEEPEILSFPTEEAAVWRVERDFIEGIRLGRTPEPSFATGVEYMRVVDAVHRSLHTRAWSDL
jgi:predicted dehydrogenase